ncbi:hypothetical protein [Neopusillimonas aromaticivorans]|uniref:hypothetical protein n=1 Tax=Neopusillimonas aromaticivorans TaxID=2979868 RepID=UPI002596BEAB|nr:hypothetical protein [Neopusillimonas aromaticivorans]WJJ93672.1 hypothetical protein N7E01_17725 [Neopusillimonas aromaticivorans]
MQKQKVETPVLHLPIRRIGWVALRFLIVGLSVKRQECDDDKGKPFFVHICVELTTFGRDLGG